MRHRYVAALLQGMVSGLDRKNCGKIAEHRGRATPDGLQHLLARARWDAADVRDDLRGYVVNHFGDPGAILVVDETPDVKKGTHTVGTQRQYTGTVVERCFPELEHWRGIATRFDKTAHTYLAGLTLAATHLDPMTSAC